MAKHLLCPVWAGYFLANRLRRLLQNPYRILRPYVQPKMTVLDVGSAMGFFSLPMAEMIGPDGKVVCIDVQPKMLEVLRRRAARMGLADRVETHVSTDDSLGLHGYDNTFEFALAFAVLHEVGDQANFLLEICRVLKPGAPLLLAEPTKHVGRPEFDRTVSVAEREGFVATDRPQIRLSYAIVLTKPRVGK